MSNVARYTVNTYWWMATMLTAVDLATLDVGWRYNMPLIRLEQGFRLMYNIYMHLLYIFF